MVDCFRILWITRSNGSANIYNELSLKEDEKDEILFTFFNGDVIVSKSSSGSKTSGSAVAKSVAKVKLTSCPLASSVNILGES